MKKLPKNLLKKGKNLIKKHSRHPVAIKPSTMTKPKKCWSVKVLFVFLLLLFFSLKDFISLEIRGDTLRIYGKYVPETKNCQQILKERRVLKVKVN